MLRGRGIDWGSGSGCLAIAAGKVEAVDNVVGLELSGANVEVAAKNAASNGVDDKVEFVQSDSYDPFEKGGQGALDGLHGQTDFILSNPPSSTGDDGFEYRRVVLRGARSFLRRGGLVFLSISVQYGQSRIQALTDEVSGFEHGGVLATTDWVPFDLRREDLLDSLEAYALEESRGGMPYEFVSDSGVKLTAVEAYERYRETCKSPMSMWQTHLFELTG